jgi:hypothetical protein
MEEEVIIVQPASIPLALSLGSDGMKKRRSCADFSAPA